ncbi:MAG: class IV adenylate cyclase [Acidobacteriia bacterium]|nr:class IV adenylate cyclase [Terriglobia bacterium]
MSSRAETEVKLAVTNLRALRRRLGQLGFRVVRPRHLESNVVYDFPDLRLWRTRCLLRLRQAGREWVLTFKGAPCGSRAYKTRQELETGVDDGAVFAGILAGLGLNPAFRYEKYRTVFAPTAGWRREAAALAELDETPIGNYLELEGPAAWIDRVATRLGYSRDRYITASYAALYREHCEESGTPPTDMVFAHRKS